MLNPSSALTVGMFTFAVGTLYGHFASGKNRKFADQLQAAGAAGIVIGTAMSAFGELRGIVSNVMPGAGTPEAQLPPPPAAGQLPGQVGDSVLVV